MKLLKHYPKWIDTPEKERQYDRIKEQDRIDKLFRRAKIAQPQDVRVLTITGMTKDGTRLHTEYRLLPKEPGDFIKVKTDVTKRNKRRRHIITITDANLSPIHFVTYDDKPGYIYIFVVKSHIALDRFTLELFRNTLTELLNKHMPESQGSNKLEQNLQ
jgi:hypothetical protein